MRAQSIRSHLRNRRHDSHLPAVLVLVLSFQVALLCPAISLAASPQLPPGVHVDPKSPAGEQYAIPLSTARGGPTGSGDSGAMFGAGIRQHPASTPQASGGTASNTSDTGQRSGTRGGAGSNTSDTSQRGAQHADGTGTAPSLTRASALVASTPPPAAKILQSGSGSGLLWMFVMAAIVLVLGGAGSFALRGRRRSTPGAG